MKVSDPALYARAEGTARHDLLVYRWHDMSEIERVEAINLALHQIELRRQIEEMEERWKLEAEKAP